ncbi:MAG: glycosyltransferase family 2 protein [Candidatus Azobacteroides sp.]|nr:glycosyltransferase family 2 protein [Candidatus Azobacteroides sp.]
MTEKFKVEMRIVIPCYNEPEVMNVIYSLLDCERENFAVEILVIVNSYLLSTESIRMLNRKSYNELIAFAESLNTPDFYLTALLVEDIPGHQTGAGLPRKIGMDEAAQRFKKEENLSGIIVSLDADCTVASNYLTEIYRHFKQYKLKSATIEFHHPIEHLDKENEMRKASEVYEEYLRYYRSALEYTGYPYAYYTIGSAFAVTATSYLQAGGMGKQQAGEDFYFLQKVFLLGKTQFIATTCVYPAPRISDRVPFGTGPAIGKMIETQQIQKLSYQVAAFTELKLLFAKMDGFFKQPLEKTEKELYSLSPTLQTFLQDDHFLLKIKEINAHTASLTAFRKRFFTYFTAFKILKYLNFVHPYPYELSDVKKQYPILKQLLLP